MSATTNGRVIPPLPPHVDPTTAPAPGMLHISQTMLLGDTEARQKAREWAGENDDNTYEKMLEIMGWAVHAGVVNEFDTLLSKVFEEKCVHAATSNPKALNMVITYAPLFFGLLSKLLTTRMKFRLLETLPS